MSDILPQATKKCTKCGVEYPATTEYFDKNRKWLSSWCKQCSRDNTKRWCEKNPEKKKSNNKRWREEHPEYNKHYYKFWCEQNPEKQKSNNKRWRDNNPERQRDNNKRWREGHKEEKRIHRQRRDAKKRALPATFTTADWIRALEYFHGVCAICQQPPSMLDIHPVLHQEHYIPLSKGGGYTPDNIIPVCQTCNFSKHDNNPEKWIIEKFGKRKGKIIIERIQGYFATIKS